MATPTDPTAVRTPVGPDGAPTMKIRRPKIVDPLVRPKRKSTTRPPVAASRAKLPPNGTAAPKPPQAANPLPNSLAGSLPAKARPFPVKDDMTVNGFSGPLLSQNYVDYPLVTTKRAWREGFKYHVAKFASKKTTDPRDETQFTRPVRLQRRDPRTKVQEPDGIKGENVNKVPMEGGNGPEEDEREELEVRKAAREKEREENLAQIAPSAATAQKRTNAPKQKTQHVAKADMTAEEMKTAKIKYEEALPWHLDDFDNKNTWVGNYEAALSEIYAMFVLEDTGKMRVVPIDKWYKFNAKNLFKTLTIEEAEKFMSKKIKDPRWFMEKQQETAQRKELETYAKQRKVYRGKQGAAPVGDGLESGELDYEEDRFADDEEHDGGLFDEDEDVKTAEKRIKQDQLKANIFDLRDEKEYDEEELKEKKAREAQKVLGKGVRKALQKREKNYDYSSGSDANPYSDDESSDDTETERLKEEERKAEEERARKEKGKESETSTKGTSTPSGRPKHTDPLKKVTATTVARKRVGSPSDASGTDTSRKKPKNTHPSSRPTPQPTSRPMSPSPPPPPPPPPSTSLQVGKKRIRNAAGGAGSASDVDGGAGSGGDMSEGGKNKKLKLNPAVASSRNGTPQGSRPGSPTPVHAGGGGATKGPTRVSTPRPTGQPSFPTPAEIHAAIPLSGILSKDLLKIFHPRLGDSRDNQQRFIALVKNVGVYGKDRLLRPGVLKES
ncbi:hypothetical protein Egran_05446 [Elaphomyces granulatus]|uniref:Uncharacterized protein n=1 Tax=Elaphomyces granulatus TaxID=519963 RepID=A0A232LRS3_9EURO|nr:hypothetical protein Egran_05446 [Elaphomyces granulatus]